ncbi:hypothetical protein Tco_0575412, partial [Tanacetum coccineum]
AYNHDRSPPGDIVSSLATHHSANSSSVVEVAFILLHHRHQDDIFFKVVHLIDGQKAYETPSISEEGTSGLAPNKKALGYHRHACD